GGPNDIDGKRNGAISDPGGVGALAPVVVEARGGGGSMHPLLGLLCAGLLAWRQRRRMVLIAAALGLVSGTAFASEDARYWYASAELAQAQGDTGGAQLSAALQAQG